MEDGYYWAKWITEEVWEPVHVCGNIVFCTWNDEGSPQDHWETIGPKLEEPK